MPKRKRGAPRKHHAKSLGSDDELFRLQDTEVPDKKSKSYFYDEIDDYNLQREDKLLLQGEEDHFPRYNFQEEVLPVGQDSEEEREEDVDDYHFDPDGEDDENAMAYDDSHAKDELEDMASDIEDDEDGIPDARAWGKKKSTYYDTDYVDKGYQDYGESDAEAAEAEEREILALEKRLTEEIQDEDFGFDMLKKCKPGKIEAEEKVQVNLKSLSKEEKLEFLKRNSPEFFVFRDEFKTKLTEVMEKLEPRIQLIKENKIPPGPWREFILAKYQTILMYCLNLGFYFLLKAEGHKATDHPVMKRIKQFGMLVKKLDSVGKMPPFDESEAKQTQMKHKKLKQKEMKENIDIRKEPTMKETQVRFSTLEEKATEKDSEECESEYEEEVPAETIASKRGITYEIAKNKGLTPYRKRELRNPRVRHRRKYEKAKVRRKGQFREPVKELRRYGGEVSGIRTTVIKSTKLK